MIIKNIWKGMVYKMKKALLIIDVQNDYFKNGKCELFKSEEALKVIEDLLKQFRTNKMPVYFVQHVSSQGAAFFEADTKGAEIHQAIRPLDDEKVIIKHYPNSFQKTTLQYELEKQGIDELVVCGMMTHMCVDTTVRAAYELGYHITLISDACATKDLEWNGRKLTAEEVQAVYMASLHGKFANVQSSTAFLK